MMQTTIQRLCLHLAYEGRTHQETPEEDLAIAIIKCAARDYVSVLRKLMKADTDIQTKRTLLLSKNELEGFFFSDWFELLTDVDPQVIVNGCKRMAVEQEKRSRAKHAGEYEHNK